ncbi:MAG TPA: hypothetical protein PKE12_00110 [Kiritimatiellia bacterium]|nr:hypothetical protein [Kiritimatiellia bacterium]
MSYSKIFLMAGLCAICLSIYPARGASSETPARPSVETLKKELTAVRADIDQSQKSLDRKVKELHVRRERIEFEDPEIAALREALTALERQVIAKREELKARAALVPEIKKIEDERREAFQRLRQLRETEAAIQRELATRERE